jgi:2-amino-4-hydroxy-6-hydroxymethyldihydropteridine diphosphokinase
VGPISSSPIYRSDPVGPVVDQPAFLNAVISFEICEEVAATQILTDLLAIEAELGRSREREVSLGPRSIDLDLLLVGHLTIAVAGLPALILPHPRLHERAFVLRPLADLVGEDYVLPGQEPVTLATHLAKPEVAEQRIEKLPPEACTNW